MVIPLHSEYAVTVPSVSLPPSIETASTTQTAVASPGGLLFEERPQASESFHSEFQALLNDAGDSIEAEPVPAGHGENQEPTSQDGEASDTDEAGSLAAMLIAPVTPVVIEAKPPIALPEPGMTSAPGQTVELSGGAEPVEELNIESLRVHARNRGLRQSELAFAMRLREKAETISATPNAPPAVEVGSEPAAAEQSAAVPPGLPVKKPGAVSQVPDGPPPAILEPRPEAKSTASASDQHPSAPRRATKAESPAPKEEDVSTGIRAIQPARLHSVPASASAQALPEARLRMETAPRTSPMATPATNQVSRIERTEPFAPEQPKTEPVRDLTLNLPVGNNPAAKEQGVAVRFMERGGEVYVTVRTGDADLATRLRSDLNGLAAGLDEHGYRVESWRPSANSGSSSGDQDTGNRDGRSSGGGTRHEQTSHGDERRQSRNRPSWLDALEHQEGENS